MTTGNGLIVIDAGFAYFGLLHNNQRITKCAPIAHYLLGYAVRDAIQYAHKRKWKIMRLTMHNAMQ